MSLRPGQRLLLCVPRHSHTLEELQLFERLIPSLRPDCEIFAELRFRYLLGRTNRFTANVVNVRCVQRATLIAAVRRAREFRIEFRDAGCKLARSRLECRTERREVEHANHLTDDRGADTRA